MKGLSSIQWGASTQVLGNTYKALIRSKLDYGATIYRSASKSTLKLLDPIQSNNLRLAMGAFQNKPYH